MGFTATPARWSDAERGIHAALIEVGVPVDEAIQYTLHSFKHLLVTAGRQLGLPEPQIDVMASWAVKSSSGTPALYDSVAASSELVYKDFVHRNIQAGRQVASEGNVPAKPMVSLRSSGAELPATNTGPARPKSTQKGADLQLERMGKLPLNQSVVQVRNVPVGTVHLFPLSKHRVKNPKPFCGRWASGSPDAPSEDAEFSTGSSTWTGDNSFFGFCVTCYGKAYPVDRAVEKVEDEGENVLASIECSSSSSSDGSSSE